MLVLFVRVVSSTIKLCVDSIVVVDGVFLCELGLESMRVMGEVRDVALNRLPAACAEET